MKEYKKVDASFHCEVMCNCPNCDAYIDIRDDVSEHLDKYNQAMNIDIEIECTECREYFIVENVTF